MMINLPKVEMAPHEASETTKNDGLINPMG